LSLYKRRKDNTRLIQHQNDIEVTVPTAVAACGLFDTTAKAARDGNGYDGWRQTSIKRHPVIPTDIAFTLRPR
jgi:hypothetical protein